jgi:TATA-box binding protein (TBP) (component of TFIID and TFIIIB)
VKFRDGSTMLVFKSGKFRIMGGKIDDLTAYFNIFKVAELCTHKTPKIILQTMTSTFSFPHKVNLALLANNIESHYNAESFPAVHIRKFKPLNVNVFASGKVIITGLKEEEVARDIECTLLTLYSNLL